MSEPVRLPHPPTGFAGTTYYVVRPREKRSFKTILDAKELYATAGGASSVVRFSADGDQVALSMYHSIVSGSIVEEIRCTRVPGGLVARSLIRQGTIDGVDRRREEVHGFQHRGLGFPETTYPEVCLPFMLGWLPLDGERRSLYAWINDRFVARMYVEAKPRPVPVELPGRQLDAIEAIMYPDLNDWVPLGGMLTKLAKPFLPKYRMWYEPAAPHRLLRFEGPYGPPGAPELVLEIAPPGEGG